MENHLQFWFHTCSGNELITEWFSTLVKQHMNFIQFCLIGIIFLCLDYVFFTF